MSAAALAAPVLLVVDDNEDNRYTLTRRLAREGYADVKIACDGREALEVLGSSRFDLVLLDIMMPHMNGYEVLERMKSDPVLRDIPVIVISAVDEMESVVRCIDSRSPRSSLSSPLSPPLVSFTSPRLPPFVGELRIHNLEVAGASVNLLLVRHDEDVGVNVLRREGNVQITVVK